MHQYNMGTWRFINWLGFKNGAQQTGFRIFEKSVFALVALSFLNKGLYSTASIKNTLIKRIKEKGELDEIRKDIAENLRRDAKEYRRSEFELNSIKASIREKDEIVFRKALCEIADAIDPPFFRDLSLYTAQN